MGCCVCAGTCNHTGSHVYCWQHKPHDYNADNSVFKEVLSNVTLLSLKAEIEKLKRDMSILNLKLEELSNVSG